MTAPARRTVSNCVSIFLFRRRKKASESERASTRLLSEEQEKKKELNARRLSRANSRASLFCHSDRTLEPIEIYALSGMKGQKASLLGGSIEARKRERKGDDLPKASPCGDDNDGGERKNARDQLHPLLLMSRRPIPNSPFTNSLAGQPRACRLRPRRAAHRRHRPRRRLWCVCFSFS